MKYHALQEGEDLILALQFDIDLANTLDCGQAFRWKEWGDSGYEGIAFGRKLCVERTDKGLVFHKTTLDEFDKIWKQYFDIDRDYIAIQKILSKDAFLKTACEQAHGITLLKQEPWECLCSFIISQNNNIPRIKGIIERLCESFGEPLAEGGFAFPSAEKIAALSSEDLAPLRAGFRTKYILDAARRVASGEIDFDVLLKMPTDKAREELMKIYGVGEKVADCVLLFSLGRIEVLPKDVWMKRVLSKLYDGALPDFATDYAGIAQQYLFHFARMTKLDFLEDEK